MQEIRFDDLAALEATVSDAFGEFGPPRTVTQDMIDRFAELTCDRQWIHVDVERARRESPFGGPDRPRLSHALAAPGPAHGPPLHRHGPRERRQLRLGRLPLSRARARGKLAARARADRRRSYALSAGSRRTF